MEYRAEQTALQVLEGKASIQQSFSLNRDDVQNLGMICGGEVHVYFRYLAPQDALAIRLTDRIEELFSNGEQSWLITELAEDRQGCLAVFGESSGLFGGPIPEEVFSALGSRPRQVSVDGRTYYCEKLVQAGRVFIFGGGHVAQSLVPALAAVDFRCIVLEERQEFCRPDLFPGVEATRLVQLNDPAVYQEITEHDYVCIMTRGHKDDLLVQANVLKTSARYIGVIGSRRKTAGVFAQLRGMGFTDRDLQRITTPIGLDILAETPAEIAVSIAAQLIMHRAERTRAEEL